MIYALFPSSNAIELVLEFNQVRFGLIRGFIYSHKVELSNMSVMLKIMSLSLNMAEWSLMRKSTRETVAFCLDLSIRILIRFGLAIELTNSK